MVREVLFFPFNAIVQWFKIRLGKQGNYSALNLFTRPVKLGAVYMTGLNRAGQHAKAG